MAQQPPVPDDFVRSFITMPDRPGIYWVPSFQHPFLVARPLTDLSTSIIVHYPSTKFDVIPSSIVSATIPADVLRNLPET